MHCITVVPMLTSGSDAGSRPTSAKWSQSRVKVQLTSSLQEQLNVKMGKLAFAGVVQVQHTKSVCSANDHCTVHSLLCPLSFSAIRSGANRRLVH